MIDVVYTLGTGSPWQDNELRYSLRSLERFISGINNVYIVGHCPDWLVNVTHLPFPDPHACKERNIMLKTAYVCGHPDLSENFLAIHDDHFALDYQDASEILNYAGGDLKRMSQQVAKQNHWREAVLNTYNALISKGHTTNNFDIHFPILINKKIFPAVMDLYDWRTPRGYVVKSLYGNTVGIKPTRIIDMKLAQRYSTADLVTRLKGRPWFSVGNAGLNGHFKMLLEALYPKVSIFEK